MHVLPARSPLKMAVLISGTGRTLQNMLEWIGADKLDGQVSVVFASTPSARGLQYAEMGNIPIAVVEPKDFGSREEYSEAMFGRCREMGIDLVVLAGFIKRITVPDDYENRVVNIHPALAPSFSGKGFYGHHVHEAVLKYGAKVSGCTVHFVDNEYDHGPVILQQTVPVLDDDTPDSLNDRVFEAECAAYPEALALIASGRIAIDGRCVRVASG